MIKVLLALLAATTLMMVTAAPINATTAPAETPAKGAEIGKPAPAFTATDSNGKAHTLSDFIGKTVVLEWTNHECPYVRKHYDTNNMQDLQKDATGKGVVWLSIVSSAQGKQGYTTGEEANKIIAKEKSAETARLLDPTGAIGTVYGASTTPHMFVIDPQGIVVYAGGIDDQPSVSHSTVKTAKNYVKAALDDLAAGKPVAVATAKPYGCNVKY